MSNYLPFPSSQLDQMLIFHTEREGRAHHHLPAAAQPEVQLPLHSPAVKRIRAWSTIIGPDPSGYCALIGWIILLLRQLSYALKTNLKAPKAPC